MSVLDALPVPASLALGFSFAETMQGSYHLLSAQTEERAIAFSIGARVAGIRQFMKDSLARIEGEIRAEGLAERRPLEGTLALKLPHERRLTYDFRFRGDDGKDYRFHGQKDVTLIALHDTMTTLPSSIYDAAGREIARAVLRFDVRADMATFLRSWRPRLGT